MSQQVPDDEKMQKRRATNKKILIGAGVLLVIIVVITSIGGGGGGGGDKGAAGSGSRDKTTEPTQRATTPTPTPSPKKPATPRGQLVSTLDDAELLGNVTRATVDPKSHAAVVTFKMADNLTNGLIRSGAKGDTLKVIGAAQQVRPRVRRLMVLGTFPMQDKYGKELGAVPVLRATYTKTDLARIQADNLTIQDSIWDLAGGGYFLNAAFSS